MKKILYIDKFFTEDLYAEFSKLSLNCEYFDTNPSKRSVSSRCLSEINHNLYEKFNRYVNEILNIEILKSSLHLYKRKNTIYNPHNDGYPLQILIYLGGEICNLDNGTFFMEDDEIILRVANIPNSAVIFDGRITHGSVQGLSSAENRGWRYSLNCFISEHK